MEILEDVQSTFLFDGYIDHFEKLIPEIDARFPYVLSHNDAQENNILMSTLDNKSLMLIDFEYSGWNPMAMDLANYINETMIDNTYPHDNGIKWYPDNCMTKAEVNDMAQVYLEICWDKYAHDRKNRVKDELYFDKATFVDYSK
jgi:thiamine kinase-like enzyme